MRILAIRGKNLASLAGPFEILLHAGPLEQAGLFAITGQTGSGKSTILDALCLALYDKMPRLPDGHGYAVGHQDEDESQRVTSNDVRSILRRGTSSAFAEVDFMGKDKHYYRARWEVGKARGKVDGRLQAQEITLSNIASGQRIGQGKKNTLEAISELINLNFDQFRRSVLLAQGDFAAFLKAKKDERSSLLERITGTDIYSDLSIAAFERTRQEKDILNRIVIQLQDQIPLDMQARKELEHQRDHFINQLIELDKQIVTNQKVLDWHAELKKLQGAERIASYALAQSQNAWNATENERILIRTTEAAQPLRPLLSQYETASAEFRDVQQKLKSSSEQRKAAETKLQTGKEQLTRLAGWLGEAEKQQQQAQPLLIKARALDIRIDIVQSAIDTLSAEENRVNEDLKTAGKEHAFLINQQKEHASLLQKLTVWLDQNQALKPIATEWPRWEAELERYQSLKTHKKEAEFKTEQLRSSVNNEASRLTDLQLAIEESHQKLEHHLETLEQLKQQDRRQSVEDLYGLKDDLEVKRNHIATALSLATNALELQQAIKTDTGILTLIEQTINENSLHLQILNRQQLANDSALSEAKKVLDLIQATTHKNAEQFRQLLLKDQPCPVCGALEHPWKDQANIGNEHAAAQLSRVGELENQRASIIKAITELNRNVSHGQEQKTTLADKLAEARAKHDKCVTDWTALAIYDKPDFPIADAELLPLLKLRNEQIISDWELIKKQEKAALELQKQIKTAQNLIDAAKLKKESLFAEYAALDKKHSQNKSGLEHVIDNSRELERQLKTIIDLLAAPFQGFENWQPRLHEATAEFKRDYAAKVKQFQQTGKQVEIADQALQKTNHDEKLSEQVFHQYRQLYQSKHADTLRAIAEKQMLLVERKTCFNGLAADSYEQTINQKVQQARTDHQTALDEVNQAETYLATHKQNHQHWQAEAIRRHNNLEKALSALNQSLEKHSLDLEQLIELLKKDDAWLAEQKAIRAARERTLQEAAALLKVKAGDKQRHESQTVEISEEIANTALIELQQRRQELNSLKEEQAILLREDDKKISTGSRLKSELDKQQNWWRQWESLNELIGSKNGVKFRVFAQSLSLEALLAHSNQHLNDFARRYSLQRVPGSDLELQIIDRDMADDVRSVHSLSGGESFLVSLALALGLASLSSNKTQVESLFIDEGFGSLDPETLDIAIASLDTLQALGRKVGVISHVPILVERIGAKVVVEKQGGGRSSVIIVRG
jgi:exonuclease SbcC